MGEDRDRPRGEQPFPAEQVGVEPVERRIGHAALTAATEVPARADAQDAIRGRGKIVVFGDPSGLTNGLTIGCHEYTSRLYAYLTDGSRGALPAAAGLPIFLRAAPASVSEVLRAVLDAGATVGGVARGRSLEERFLEVT